MTSRRLLIIAALAASSACDPCTGVVGCTVSPHIGASGRILDEVSGIPVAGIAIDLVRTGGVPLERDSLRTTTDEDGLFAFSVAAQSSGVATGYIRVHPHDSATYRVTGLEFPTTTRRGESRTFAPWSTVPHLPDIAEIYVRGAPPMLAASTRVEFRRTGGVAVRDLSSDVFARESTPAGWVSLFGSELRPIDAGDVIGDLTVYLSDGPLIRRDLHVSATPVWRPGLTIRRLGVGPSLEYHIAVHRRGRSGVPVQGAQVQFRQTGGIEVVPADWTSSTDAAGRVALPVRTRETGVLTGDLTIVPPAPWKSFEKRELSFATFEADTAILFAVVEAGPGISTYVVFTANGTPIKGVAVDFRRTGGLEVEPRNFTAVSNDTGFTYLVTSSALEGTVTADLTVRPPPPYANFVVRNVQIPATDGETAQAPPVFATWNVASPPSSVRRSRP